MVTTLTGQPASVDAESEERRLRIELAAAYRLADKFGLSEIVNTHISLRLPGTPSTYLLNPYGMLFGEVTASSLVKMDMTGNIVGESEYGVNAAGVAIHGTIQNARPDINCVFHTHTPYSTAVASLECGLLPMSQASLQFHGRIAYHEYGQAASDPYECAKLARDMGDKWFMLMRNHGALTLGRTVGQAFMWAFYLEKACQFQVLAQSTGQNIILTPEESRHTADPARVRADALAWPGLVRMLDREDQSYKD